MANHIRGIRQGIPGGYILGRKGGTRGPVTAIPLGNGAGATSTAGGFVPQSTQTTGFTSFNSAGVWSSTAGYNPGDVVTYNGGAYVNYVAVSAPGPNTSPDMDDAHWFSQGVVNTVDSNFAISAGQLQLATIASGDVLGNSGAGTAEPTAATLTAMIDRAFGSTEGQILQRGASAWQVLAPGSAGQVLLSGGSAALNSWGTDELGVATNSSASAGYKGEYVSSSVLLASGVSLSNGVGKQVTSISLTAGDWDVGANIVMDNQGGTAITEAVGAIDTTSAAFPDRSLWLIYLGPAIDLFGGAVATQRFSLSSTTPIYLNADVAFTGTAIAYGLLWARRVR